MIYGKFYLEKRVLVIGMSNNIISERIEAYTDSYMNMYVSFQPFIYSESRFKLLGIKWIKKDIYTPEYKDILLDIQINLIKNREGGYWYV